MRDVSQRSMEVEMMRLHLLETCQRLERLVFSKKLS